MRIARAAKSLGATSLSVCAPEDVTSPHVEYADEHVVLEKGTTAIAPYLDIERLTKVAVENDVDFVHPGNDIMISNMFMLLLFQLYYDIKYAHDMFSVRQ